jgi:nicotinate-nucleotide--dimethylbenzimidazole phosphoribosyltransferase
MGIANTTSASALLCAFTGVSPAEATGPGTGLDRAGVSRKAEVIERALALHAAVIQSGDAVRIAAALGGFEIVTMAGFFLGAARHRLPVVVDGFITTAAALVARAIAPQVIDYLVFSHASAEPAHRSMLAALGATAALQLEMRLGEGTGAALLMPVIDAAIALYKGMASFDEAKVTR